MSVRRWVLIVYWITMYVATHWPDINRYKPEEGWPIPRFGEVMHAGIYAGWAVLWWWYLRSGGRRVSRSAINWLIAGGTAYGAFDELTQAVVDRTPAVDDFLFNVIGIVVALFVLNAWQTRKS